MKKEILDKVMQEILHIDYGTKIRCNYGSRKDPVYHEYIYNEDGLVCTSHRQGYKCDYIIVGMLLGEDDSIEVLTNIDYKKCWEELTTLIHHVASHSPEYISTYHLLDSIINDMEKENKVTNE